MKTGARGGGAQRPALQVSELKKTGARSARARTRGQNPLVKPYCSICAVGYAVYGIGPIWINLDLGLQ
jgi:hypothetical protein